MDHRQVLSKENAQNTFKSLKEKIKKFNDYSKEEQKTFNELQKVDRERKIEEYNIK